jgi:hypothetical protein
MTQAVVVRRDGDTFQARLFWWRAARLLDDASPIIKVGFESGPKSFDDIWVEYDSARSPPDQIGRPLLREHIQCKWHVSPDNYGYIHLIDPEFINANAKSLLQRARAAQLSHAPEGAGCRFKLLTNWRIDRADPLRELIGSRSNAMRLERLFGTQTDNSKAGQVRKAWREHLGIDEAELRVLAGTLAFGEATDSLDDWRDHLDALFGFVGLRRVPANESAFLYDNLVFEWMAQQRLEFDRQTFRAACAREGLLAPSATKPIVFGVKSFEHPVDRLQDRCAEVLDLVPVFDERYIRSQDDWTEKLYPELKTFLLKAASDNERIRLALDTHVTLAFAAGSILNIKSGRAIELEQRTTSRAIWAADDAESDPVWPSWSVTRIDLDRTGSDLAVAVGLTHDVSRDVDAFVRRQLPAVGSILVAQPSNGPGARSVACGRHAFELAETLTSTLRSALPKPSSTLHLFIAAPNAFTFFLGQRQSALGSVHLYEFDFDGQRDRSYRRSIILPFGKPPNNTEPLADKAQ